MPYKPRINRKLDYYQTGGGGGNTGSISAGTTNATLGQIVFSNSNGVSFGLNGQTLTASANGVGDGLNRISAGTQLAGTMATVIFSNSNGVSFGMSNSSVITAQHNGLTNIRVSAGTQSNYLSAVTFSNSNNVSFGLNGSIVTASASHNQTIPDQYWGMTSGLDTNFYQGDTTFTNNFISVNLHGNVSGGYDTNGLNISVPIGNGYIVVGTNTVTLGSVEFANNQNVQFDLYGGNTISATAFIVASAGTTDTNAFAFSFSDANGISFGLDGATVTAQHNGLTSQSNQAFSASGGSSAFQTLNFQSSNGITFSNNAGAIRVTHDLQFTSNTSAITSNALNTSASRVINIIAATNNTGGGTASLSSNVSFSNANGMTFYTSAGNAIVGSYTVPTQSVQTQSLIAAVYDGVNSISTGTIRFTNANGVSFSINGQTLSGSVAAQTNQTVGGYAVGNTTQSSSGTFDARSFSFRGEGVASVGVSNGSVVVSVPAGGGGLTNINVSGGTTSNNLSNIVFSNSNGVSFGLNGSTMTASVGAEGGGLTVSMFPETPFPLASSSAYSGATTTTAGGSRTTYSLYLSPMVVDKAVSFNTAGFMMSHATVAGTGSFTNAQMFGIYSLNADTAMSLVSTFQFGLHVSQSSVTARSHRWWWGTNSNANSSSVGGNISASVAKMNLCVLHSQATSLAASHYWLGYMQTMSVSSAIGSFSVYHLSLSQTTAGSLFGTNVSVSQDRFCGIVSGTVSSNAAHVNIMPSSIHTSAITGTGGSSQNRWNIISLGSR